MDALVVGAGPVGLAVAALLGRAGWAVVVLEPRAEITASNESRAITWMPEGILLADELGLTGDLHALASTRTRHEFRRHPAGRAILTLKLDELDHPHPYTFNLPQHATERLLERVALATGQVDIKRGLTVTDVRQTGRGVVAVAVGIEGHTQTFQADIGIGADGARSARSGVANLLGIAADFRDYGARSVVADLDLDVDPSDGAISWVALEATRPTGAFKFGDNRWRLIFRLNPDDPPDGTREDLASSIASTVWPGVEIRRALWVSSFQLGQGQTRAYVDRRWFLVGDSAHAMGPSAGAGMMVGLLGAWHLSRVLSSDGSLAVKAHEYESRQRRVSTSVQSANEMIFRNLAIRSPLLAAARGVALSAIGNLPMAAARLTAQEALVGMAPKD